MPGALECCSPSRRLNFSWKEDIKPRRRCACCHPGPILVRSVILSWLCDPFGQNMLIKRCASACFSGSPSAASRGRSACCRGYAAITSIRFWWAAGRRPVRIKLRDSPCPAVHGGVDESKTPPQQPCDIVNQAEHAPAILKLEHLGPARASESSGSCPWRMRAPPFRPSRGRRGAGGRIPDGIVPHGIPLGLTAATSICWLLGPVGGGALSGGWASRFGGVV